MKLLILKDSRVRVKAGEIVEVSPAEAGFLMSTGSARKYFQPEAYAAAAEREIPEKTAPEKETRAVKAPAKTTRKK